MYKEYFGLKEAPFSISPDPHYFFVSAGHREALAHLMYGVNSDGGFVLLTGEVGTGKTTVCRCLIEQMPENCEVAFILNPKLSSVELLAAICDEFGISYPKGGETIKDLVSRLNDFLLTVHESERRAILIIEEAQNLTVEVLEQIRLLTNLETSQRKLLQIIMLGQPELRDLLAKPELRQLSQRITARYHLGPLTEAEIPVYLNHRLSVAGLVRGELFPQSTIKVLGRITGGVPRLINTICDRALLGAYIQGKDRVDKDTLLTAAREVSGEKSRETSRTHRSYLTTIFIALLINALIAAGLIYYIRGSNVKNYAHTLAASFDGTERGILDKEHPGAQTRNHASGGSSRDMAYQALFATWQTAYDPKDGRPVCKQAETRSLACLEGKGDLEMIRRMNKPVVLRLIDGSGRDYYATLTSLQEQNATYTIEGKTKSANINELIQRWSGDYTALWRLPAEYKGLLRPGGRGPFVVWLQSKLALLKDARAQQDQKFLYDAAMVGEVKAFQATAGLSPDGIIGPTTIGQLLMRVGGEGPALYTGKARK